MPKKYYCDYCEVFLKNSSRLTRYEHNKGKRHKANKVLYFQKIFNEIDYQNMLKAYLVQKESLQMINMNTINSVIDQSVHGNISNTNYTNNNQ